MITKYKIFEGFLKDDIGKMYSFINNYFNKYLKDTDFKIYNEYNSSEIKYSKLVLSKQIYIRIFYNNVNYSCSTYYTNNKFNNLKDLKYYFDTKLCNDYYNDMLKLIIRYPFKIDLETIIPLDRNKYSEFIYTLLFNDKYKIHVINMNKKYLTDEYKDKIEVYLNAKNFDLI